MSEYLPIYRDDHELLGFVVESSSKDLWIPMTIFKIPFNKPMDKNSAISQVLENGLQILSEKWEFYSKDDKEWHACLILEAKLDSVKIKEGISPQGDGEIFAILNPDEGNLRLLDSGDL